MKVLIVGPYSSPIIQRLTMNLRNSEHDVLVASYNAENIEGVINLGIVESMFDYFRFYKINKIVRDFQPDIVHAHIVNHYGLMSMLQPKPLLVALWGSDIMIAPYSGRPLKRLFYRSLNKIVLKRATRCHTSGHHVAEEADDQYKGTFKKTDVFYWGFPLLKPDDIELKVVENRLKKEFGLIEDDLIVFPRGLASIYNPKIVSIIINKLIEKNHANKIVVLKGFATGIDEKYFKSLVNLNLITYIDRLLTSDELYYIYSKTKIHFSIPVSDSLGGGVVEPALLGSYPILSDLPSYREYSKKNECYILEDYENSTLDVLCKKINDNEIGKSVNNIPNSYALSDIMYNLFSTYQKVEESA